MRAALEREASQPCATSAGSLYNQRAEHRYALSRPPDSPQRVRLDERGWGMIQPSCGNKDMRSSTYETGSAWRPDGHDTRYHMQAWPPPPPPATALPCPRPGPALLLLLATPDPHTPAPDGTPPAARQTPYSPRRAATLRIGWTRRCAATAPRPRPLPRPASSAASRGGPITSSAQPPRTCEAARLLGLVPPWCRGALCTTTTPSHRRLRGRSWVLSRGVVM